MVTKIFFATLPVVDLSQHQAAENGRVRVESASPTAGGAVAAKPGVYGAGVHPEGKASPAHEG